MHRVRSRSLLVAVAAVGFSVLVPPSVAAQVREDGRDLILSGGDDPKTPDYNVTRALAPRGFQLFANVDGAGAGMATGDLSYNVSNYGPCDAPLTGFCRWSLRPSRNLAASTFQFFEILYYAGAPPSEWVKIRSVAPSVANAAGGGYVTLMNFALFRPQFEWGPADGSLTRLHSGAVSTGDESCLDQTGFDRGSFRAGLPSLATSDCPATWPVTGWGGDRNAPRAAFRALMDEQGSSFEFDYWRVPDSLKHADAFLGSSRSTYGESSDHYAEILAEYGSVIPGGTGVPKWGGYPLGLVWRFEVFRFRELALQGVVFWRATVINRSEDVYGTGIDYDSLYLGYLVGTGGSGAGGRSRYSDYFLPSTSTALYHQSNVRGPGGPCSDGTRLPAGAVGCASQSAVGRGYGNGGNALVVLKSPIGDLRNKLFTRTPSGAPCAAGVDRFCDPAHPSRGDTITFNHGHMCGFGGCWASTHNVSDKRSFGMISSQADLVMDGRDPRSLSRSEAFRTFRNVGYPAEIGVFNHWVPGVEGPPAASWDYDHDGVPDTLWLDTCHVDGCVVTDWDTLPGGHVNSYGNVGGVLAAGPFPLAAGDSTSWYLAFVGQRDSARTWAAIDAATKAYLEFFPRPGPPPVPALAAPQTSATRVPGAPLAPAVTLRFDVAAERWVDPWLMGLADDVEQAVPGSVPGDLFAANPWLADSLREAATNNVEVLEIYKSCDGGRTFTGDADCTGDPTVGTYGRPVGTGWQAYASFFVDAYGGNLPNAFLDSAVTAGRSYTYVLVTKSRGVSFTVTTQGVGAGAGAAVREFAPSLRSPLVGPGARDATVEVYVPVSGQAGGVAVSATFTERAAGVTVPFDLALTDRAVPGSYRAVFGNRIVVERDSVESSGEVTQTTVRVERVVAAAPGGVPTVVRREEAVRVGGEPFLVQGRPASTATTTPSAGIVRTATRYDRLGFVLLGPDGAPVFATVELSGPGATPDALLGTPSDPGFAILADDGRRREFDRSGEVVLRGPIARQVLATAGDTVPRATADSFMVQWREQDVAVPTGTGVYRVRWVDEAFGLPAGLTLNFPNLAASEQELRAALAARAVGQIGLIDIPTAELAGVPAESLVAVRLPFTIANETFGHPVDVVMLRRGDNTLLVGGGADTARLRIPPDAWVPGDVLVLLETGVEEVTDPAGNVVLTFEGVPQLAEVGRVTFARAVLGCNRPRPSCNPAAPFTPGGGGYVPLFAGDETVFHYRAGFREDSRYAFEVAGPVRGEGIAGLTEADLAAIRVVPNPFVLFSAFQRAPNEPRVVFTNMPPRGTLRIYTVSAQLVQQIRWTPADLGGAGDLHVALVTQAANPFASGLYLWVLTAPRDPADPAGAAVRARGKFVVIQGTAR